MLEQTSLYELLPGSPGGRALAAQCQPGYYSRIGAAGGAATLASRGRGWFVELGRAGRAAQRRHQLEPRRISYDGSPVLIIPWFPPRSHPAYSSRRRRPLQVWVWEGAGDE